MIKLRVLKEGNNSRDIWYDLDTYGNENIALTFQVDEIRNIKNKNASYSKNFNLPATKNNNKFFEHYYDLDRYNLNYNAYKSNRVELEVDGIVVLEGYMKLLGTLEKQTEISYNIVIYNDVANLIDSLGDTDMSQLSLPELEHNFTYDNVISSWFGIDLGGNPVPYSYTLINQGDMYEDSGDIFYNPMTNWILNIKLKYVIDKIFAYAGFTYESNFFNGAEFDRLYFDTTTIKSFGDEIEPYEIKIEDLQKDIVMGATNQSIDAIQISDNALNPTIPEFTTITGDVNNEWDLATSTFTPTFNCTLTILGNINVGNISGNNFTFTVYANNVAIYSQNVGSDDPQAAPPFMSPTAVFFAVAIPVLAGQSQQISFSIDYTSQVNAGVYDSGVAQDNTFLHLQVSNASSEDLVQTQLGDIKLADVLKDVFTMFNLVASDLGNRRLKIEPYVSYISQNTIDWTKKVDINELELEVIDIPRRLIFKHAEDKDDFYHEDYKTNNGQDYGSHIVSFDVDNREEEVIELKVFAAPFVKAVEGSDIQIQHIAKDDGNNGLESFKNKPRMVYRVADILDGTSIALTGNTLKTIEQFIDWNANDLNTYNQMLHFSKLTNLAVSGDRNYLFGLINPIAITNLNQQPVNTLFSRFWRDYINEKYNVDTRILKTKLRLSATDILNLDFSLIYIIDMQHYRLNKVDYNTDKNKLSSVEFIRI